MTSAWVCGKELQNRRSSALTPNGRRCPSRSRCLRRAARPTPERRTRSSAVHGCLPNSTHTPLHRWAIGRLRAARRIRALATRWFPAARRVASVKPGQDAASWSRALSWRRSVYAAPGQELSRLSVAHRARWLMRLSRRGTGSTLPKATPRSGSAMLRRPLAPLTLGASCVLGSLGADWDGGSSAQRASHRESPAAPCGLAHRKVAAARELNSPGALPRRHRSENAAVQYDHKTNAMQVMHAGTTYQRMS